MKIGDIVKWTTVEECYHLAFGYSTDLPTQRQSCIIIDKNPVYFFVFWQNGETLAQKPETIEVIK